MFPHELIEARLRETLGRRVDALGPLSEDLLIPLIVGLADQLSIYQDCRPSARVEIGRVHVREGGTRAWVLAEIRDRGGALRLRDVMANWAAPLPSSRPEDWVAAQNARRWRFVERSRRLLDRLLAGVAEAVDTYTARRPGARLEVSADATTRLLEGVDATWLAVEMDVREMAVKDTAARWRVE